MQFEGTGGSNFKRAVVKFTAKKNIGLNELVILEYSDNSLCDCILEIATDKKCEGKSFEEMLLLEERRVIKVNQFFLTN